jgi:plastocyanin
LTLALPAGAAAADAVVAVKDAAYEPAAVKVAAGDTVTWDWQTSLLTSRSVTPDSGTEPPDSGLQFAPYSHQYTFPTPGTYGYHDTGGGGQTGSITVYGTPTVALAPAAPTVNRGTTVEFTATAASNPAGSPIAYDWDLNGDGSYETSAGTAQSVAFPIAGAFNVGVRVTDEVANVATATVAVQVTVPDTDADGLNDDLDKCVNEPAATPDGCPLIPPVIPAEIVATATAATTVGLQAALESGVPTVLNCTDRCSGIFTLTRSGRTVGTTTQLLTSAGSKVVTVRFSRSGKRSLARLRSARLLLTVLVTDAIGRTQTVRATVTLKRTARKTSKLAALGISDQQPTTFSDPLFQVLRLRYARLMTPWDSIFTEPERLDQWLQAARAAGVRPLVAFERERGSQCPRRPCRFPSKGKFTRAFKAFRKKYPWVREISPWNEVNSATQPTGKRPHLAALYYNVVRANCRGCTIVAADLLDSSNIRRYTAAFLKKAKGKPRLWGLHNYSDTNRFRSRGTQALLESVKGTVWLTETGGVVKFVTQDGKVALPQSERRAKKAMDYMFKLAAKNAKRIKRLYVYQWKVNNVFDRFDAGVVRPDGKPRPSYHVLTLNASMARKRR